MRLGLAVNSVSRYENNTQEPPIDKLRSLAIMYRTSVDYIMGMESRTHLYLDDLPTDKQQLILDIIDKIIENTNLQCNKSTSQK